MTLSFSRLTIAGSKAKCETNVWDELILKSNTKQDDVVLDVIEPTESELDSTIGDIIIDQQIPRTQREWIDIHYDALLKLFNRKTIIVMENKIYYIFDGFADIIQVNDKARELGLRKEWTYEYISGERSVLI